MFKLLRNTSLSNFLVIAIMVFMIGLTALFVHAGLKLKDKITYRVVQQTDLVSDLVASSALDIMSAGHGGGKYSKLLDYGKHVGIDEIGIFGLDGEEAFTGGGEGEGRGGEAPRKIGGNERMSFKSALATMNSTGFFDHDALNYSKYIPLKAEGACTSCHMAEGEPLGVLVIRLPTSDDFMLLNYARRLIWILGLVVLLPVGGLLMAVAIIREKSRLYSRLKESNASLQKTYCELDETRNNLQLILDNSKVLIITTDTEGRIVEFNKEAEALLEYAKEEAVGKDVLMLYADSTERSGVMRRAEGRAGGGGGVWEARNREVTLKGKSGKTCHLIITLSTMVDNRGEIIGTVGVGKDISEQKMLQFKLLQSEKLAGIGTLASGIAHEINNPLAAILGMAEAIRDEDDVALIRSYTEDIIQYCANANRIVQELSTYSRSAQSAQKTVLDLSCVMRNSLKMARHSASRFDIRITTELGGGCTVMANTVEMQQIFVNLIVNAIQAMECGGELRLECGREGTFVVATVADTGPGIPEEDLSKIFDPFFTTKPVGKGTGLGLYVVYRLVTKHGGSIDVRAGASKGCIFTLRFPYSKAEAALQAV
ncbi:MAG: nitrogen regulation protein NR(II) [Thermodesulfobacteriota bacterium]